MMRDFVPHQMSDIVARFMSPARDGSFDGAGFFSDQRTWPVKPEETFYILPIDWEYDDDEEVGAFIEQHRLDYCFHGSQLDDVISVARNQRPQASATDVLEAYNHYLEYDAFLVWSE